jgi:hypothetical protein
MRKGIVSGGVRVRKGARERGMRRRGKGRRDDVDKEKKKIKGTSQAVRTGRRIPSVVYLLLSISISISLSLSLSFKHRRAAAHALRNEQQWTH